jgi:hypothetical protein
VNRLTTSFFVKRNVRWSLAWVVVSIPLTLALTVPATSPDAQYLRATIRAQRLEASLSEPAASVGRVGTMGLSLTRDDARYTDYLMARAVERRAHAVAFPWARRFETFELLLLTVCVVPAWLAFLRLAKRKA